MDLNQRSFNETLRGTTLQSANNVSLTAGKDITLQASSVNAINGAASLWAIMHGRDLSSSVKAALDAKAAADRPCI